MSELAYHLHDHLVRELQQSSRTDTVFVVTAVVFNLVVLGINWAVAASDFNGGNPTSDFAILGVLIVVTLAVNACTAAGLVSGKGRASALVSGLTQLYADGGLEKYYDPLVVRSYGARYNLFIAVVLSLGVAAVAVPLIELLMS